MRSIELVFDDPTDFLIKADWARLADAGLPGLAAHTSPSRSAAMGQQHHNSHAPGTVRLNITSKVGKGESARPARLPNGVFPAVPDTP